MADERPASFHTIGRHLRATFATAAVLIAASTLLLPVIGRGIVGVVVLVVVWGLAHGCVPVCSQTWTARSSESPEAATVLFTASFRATIGIGAVLGGVLLDATSVSVVMVCGGAAAVLVALVVLRAPRWMSFSG